MMKLLIAYLIAPILMLLPLTASAQSVCDSLFESSWESNTAPSLWRGMLAFFKDDPEVTSQRSALLDEAPYWVTINEGTAFSANCQADGVVKSVYFPIGLVLRPVVDLHKNGNPNLSVFLAEYGLYIILDRRVAVPIRQSDAYYFADGIGEYPLCINSSRQNPNCDPLSPSRKSAAALSSKYGYVLGASSPELQRRLELLSAWKNKRTVSPNDQQFLCDRFHAGGFFHRGETTPGYSYVTMSMCAYKSPEQRTGLAYKPTKIVTAENAESFMYEGSPTLYLKRADFAFSLFSFFKDAERLFKSHKSCGEELNMESFQTVGLSGGLSWDKVLNFEVTGEMKNSTSFKREFAKSETFIISSYINLNAGTANEPFELLKDVNDIWLLAKCDESDLKPTKATEIIIYYSGFSDGFLVLYPDYLNEIYNEDFQNYSGPALKESKRNLQNGIIWEHQDYQDYYFWRTVLARALREDAKFEDLVAGMSDVEVDKMTNYFSHLVMAAVFSSKIGLNAQ